jgi:hypothetical protein
MYQAILIVALSVATLAGLTAACLWMVAASGRITRARQDASAIAARAGSISCFQLSAQSGISMAAAEGVLKAMCQSGRLFESADGAYYTTPQKLPEASAEGIWR